MQGSVRGLVEVLFRHVLVATASVRLVFRKGADANIVRSVSSFPLLPEENVSDQFSVLSNRYIVKDFALQ